jgi:hypothetical protein
VSSESEISIALSRLRTDYAESGHCSGPFQHFYCPILCKDERAKLCRGHVVNQAICGSSNVWVVQREDVDGFYGTVAESEFTTIVNADGVNINKVLKDRQLRKKIPLKVSVEGEECDHYEVFNHRATSHPTVAMMDGEDKILEFALKTACDRLPASPRLEFQLERDYLPGAVASLIKAAHLTMFSVLGYRYVFGAAGQELAGILRRFYEKNKGKPKKEQVSSMESYFPPYAGMIIPLAGYSGDLLRGSIDDKRFIFCLGSSGRPFSVGVLIKTGEKMNIVLLPPEEAEPMDTYVHFTKEKSKPFFHYRFTDFIDAKGGEPAHFNVYANGNMFDPHKIADTAID